MIANATLDAFDHFLATLANHAPLDTLVAAGGPREAALEAVLRGLPPTADLLSADALPRDPRRAAVIGVIDHAVPFAHPRLVTAAGASRVAAVWLQGAPMPPGAPAVPDVAFGRELLGTQIDALRSGAGGAPALDDEGLYRATGMIDLSRPGGPGLAAAATHGAAVAGLAGGRDPADPAGRDHPVIAVSVPGFAVADSSGAYMPFYLAIGVIYVIARARRVAAQLRAAGRRTPLPVVINLSFGVSAGPHDGSTLLERLLDAIGEGGDAELGPVHLVLPTGNHRQQRLHARPAAGEVIDWVLPPDDATPSTLEVWGPTEPRRNLQPFNIDLTLPDGTAAATQFAAIPAAAMMQAGGAQFAGAWLQFRGDPARPGHGRQCLTLIANPTLPARVGDRAAPAGRWRLRLVSGPTSGVAVHVQRDDRVPGLGPGARGRQSALWAAGYAAHEPSGRAVLCDAAPPGSAVRRAGAVNAYAGGRRPIRVGGRLGPGIAADLPLPAVAPYSALLATGSAGDVLAPCERGASLPGIAVPSVRRGGLVSMAGTSLAAAQVTAWLAGCLAQDGSLDSRAAVVAAAQAGQGAAPHP